MTHRSPKTLPTGVRYRNGGGRTETLFKVAIGFDGDMFVEIKEMAAKEKISFAQQVRELCLDALRLHKEGK